MNCSHTIQLLLACLFIFSCSKDTDGLTTADKLKGNNFLTTNQTTATTLFAHLFVYENEQTVSVVISTNNSADWYSYNGPIQFFELELDKLTIGGSYTFSDRSSNGFDPKTNFGYAASALTQMENGQIIDTNAQGTGLIDSWYDTANASVIGAGNFIQIKKIDSETYELVYFLELDATVIEGYYYGKLDIINE